MGELYTSIDLAAIGGLSIADVAVEEVLSAYKTSPKSGLSSESAVRRYEVIGANEIVAKKKSRLMQFLSFLANPLSYVMLCAALVAVVVANGGGLAPDWEDFLGIVILLLINATLGYIEESKAGNAVEALMASLSLSAQVKRDGKWIELDAKLIVPGDIIAVKLGKQALFFVDVASVCASLAYTSRLRSDRCVVL